MRKRTHRKVYAERKEFITSLFNADEPMPESERVETLTSLHAAALALSRGFGDAHHWDTLIVAFNIAVNVCAMAKNGHIGLNPVNEARNALISVRERAHEIGRYVFRGEELSAVNGGIHVYEQIIQTVGRRQYVRACKIYTRDADAGKTRKIVAGQGTKRFNMVAVA